MQKDKSIRKTLKNEEKRMKWMISTNYKKMIDSFVARK